MPLDRSISFNLLAILQNKNQLQFDIMASDKSLKGIELIDCAKANAQQGISTTAQLCGYGSNLNAFELELKQACQEIGVEINELADLITDRQRTTPQKGLEIMPDTPSQL
jgi:hypothetical protein